MLATCRELGIGFLAYSPLGRGFLSGQIKSPADLADDDFRKTNPRFVGEAFEKNQALVRKIEALAKDKGVTASQLALAWTLARTDFIVPIFGTKRASFVEENAKSVDVALTAAELDAIEAVFSRNAAFGSRYAEAMMKFVNV